MGNYIFGRRALLRELYEDAQRPDSQHDFGRDILPSMLHRYPMHAYDFEHNEIPGEPIENRGYWRDVGTIEAYWETNMDLRAIAPSLNLYNRQWPLHTANYNDPPAKFAFDDEGRRGQALNSLVSEGCILSGGVVQRAVLGRNVFIHSHARVEDSIILDGCDIGRGARINRAILDKNVRVPAGTVIGYDPDEDRSRYFVSETGIVVISGVRTRVEISSVGV
jgi:glucose-1-phosphate adenylyltransferase